VARIFLSSTFTELATHREAAGRAIRDAGHELIALDGVASSETAAAGSTRLVRESDAVVLILGILYGSRPSAESPSFTHLEFTEAVNAGKPIFVFNADLESHSVPARLVMTPLALQVEIDAAAQLRAAAATLRSPQTFRTPEELAARVGVTLRLHFPVTTVGPAASAADGISPDLLPKLCDRGDQLTAFQRHFRPLKDGSENVPLLYMIPGTDDQAHESCVRALVWHEIQNQREGLDPAYLPPVHRFVEWPTHFKSDPHQTTFNRLLWRLHAAVEPNYAGRETSVDTFCALAQAAKVSYLVLRHPLHQLDAGARAILQKYYVPFWDGVARQWAGQESVPRLLVFLEIRCTREPDDRAGEALERSLKRAFKAYLRNVDATASRTRRTVLRRHSNVCCVAEVLPWLPDVDAGAFSNWVQQYERWLPERVQTLDFAEEFQSAGVPMKAFERRMKTLLATSTTR
jgi:hypothetical protein